MEDKGVWHMQGKSANRALFYTLYTEVQSFLLRKFTNLYSGWRCECTDKQWMLGEKQDVV